MSSICIVDDNRPTLVRLSRAFGAAGFDNVMTESDPLVAVSRIREHCPDVLVVDYNMPQLNGLAMVEMLRHEGIVPHLPAVLLSGLDLSELRLAAFKAGVRLNPIMMGQAAALSEQALMEKVAPGYPTPEGLFYPDTYLFARGSSDLLLYQQAHAQMKKVLEQTWARRSPDVPYKSPYEALIMASIVEKETGLQAERKQIAAVFVNRLKRGMLLQTDPTVIYGMGERFDGNIRKQDLLTDSAYNTYLRSGLPPTPIALAGSAAIEAALNPAPTSDLFFVARGDGSSQFSETLEQHNAAVDRYQRNPAKAQ